MGIRLVSRARLGRGTSLVASTPPRGDAGLAMMALILAPIVFIIQNWLAYLIALAIVAVFIALLVGGLILFHWLDQRQAERVERERLDHYTRTEEEARRLAAERYFRQAEAHGQKQEKVDRVETPATARNRDMLRLEPPAMIAARHALPATVALLLLLLLLAPTDAVAAPNTPFASLCGRVLTGITFSARQAISLNRVCTITVGAGGVLRIADSNIGGRDLRLNLRGGGAVEARRSGISPENLTVGGVGTILVEDSRLGAITSASIAVTGNVALIRSEFGGRVTGISSSLGTVSLTDSRVGGRDGGMVFGARGVSLLWSALYGGVSSPGVGIGDGGDLSIIASTINGPAINVGIVGTASSITIVGSDLATQYVPFAWPEGMPSPDWCAAHDNLPEVSCPLAVGPEPSSGPRYWPAP